MRFASRSWWLVLAVCVGAGVARWAPGAEGDAPRSHDPRLRITLFAEQPQITTPTGIDVDAQGRVWAIESNTHFRPNDYPRNATDRILVFEDADRDGTPERVVTFLDGLTHSMSVAARPVWLDAATLRRDASGAGTPATAAAHTVYIATRAEIFLCRDLDGDLVCDDKKRIVHLETKGNYPHNGLAGFAFSPTGEMYFGFGENLGADYSIHGSDGAMLRGGGEGGNVYRCRPDGTSLVKFSTGYWNPHASCVDAFGQLFTVDNDPDSRPPCRLMHVIPNSDFGYRFRNGRKGLHPFTSWNGENPGMLPMVSGTGEAPSGIVAYEGSGLPAEYVGNLLVTSWGDHRIDRFRLQPRGQSFTSVMEPLISGGENFRPVGLATAPDGSLFLTDWVLRDYKLHGKGRIWKIAPVKPGNEPILDATRVASQSVDELKTSLSHPRLDIRRTAARRLAHSEVGRAELSRVVLGKGGSDRARLEAWWSLQSRAAASMNDADAEPALAVLRTLLARPELQLASLVQAGSAAERDPLARHVRELLQLPAALDTTGLLKRLGLRLAPPPTGVGSFEAWVAEVRDDPFAFSRAIDRFAEVPNLAAHVAFRGDEPGDHGVYLYRQAALLAGWRRDPQDVALIRKALQTDPRLIRTAVQWAAEEKLTALKPDIEALWQRDLPDTATFLAIIGALEILDGKKPEDFDKTPAATYVAPLLFDVKRPASVRLGALQMVSPADPLLTVDRFRTLLADAHPPLARESVWSLALSPRRDTADLLLDLSQDRRRPLADRLVAVMGLAAHAADVAPQQPGAASRDAAEGAKPASTGNSSGPVSGEATGTAAKVIEQLLTFARPRGNARDADDVELQIAAWRSLRGNTTTASVVSAAEELFGAKSAPGAPPRDRRIDEQLARIEQRLIETGRRKSASVTAAPRPASLDEWLARTPGDAHSGRITFFHMHSAGCARCHTVNGRGGNVGPDLSTIARTADAKKLLESILQPSREIAPQYTNWTIETKEGKIHQGLIVHENQGKTTVGDAQGKTVTIATVDIVERTPQRASLMPEKLADQLTVTELSDLLAYLLTLK